MPSTNPRGLSEEDRGRLREIAERLEATPQLHDAHHAAFLRRLADSSNQTDHPQEPSSGQGR